MATTPSTIVVICEDKVALPLSSVLVIMKQIFQYGVKEITLKGDKVFISLSYSPKSETLRRKFGNLPVRYIRTKIDGSEELEILENALKKYKFNIHEDEPENAAIGNNSRGKYLTSSSSKKKLKITALSLSSDEDDEELEVQPPPTKRTRRAVKEQTEAEIEDLMDRGVLTQMF